MNKAVKLTEEQMKNLCKQGQRELCCSFLIMAGSDGMCCSKGTSFESAIIERRPTMNAKGDNCSGPPAFKPKENPIAKTPANTSI